MLKLLVPTIQKLLNDSDKQKYSFDNEILKQLVRKYEYYILLLSSRAALRFNLKLNKYYESLLYLKLLLITNTFVYNLILIIYIFNPTNKGKSYANNKNNVFILLTRLSSILNTGSNFSEFFIVFKCELYEQLIKQCAI